MTGGYFALRERVFDYIAQEIGLSCQSCVFLTLPLDCEPMNSDRNAEPQQGAITYIQPHAPEPCSSACDLEPWLNPPNSPSRLQFLAQLRIEHATDLIVGNVLGNLCGANERGEFVVSRDHRLFLIDNELTLLIGPDVRGALEYIGTECGDNSDWRHVAEILVPKLELMGSISDSTLKSFTEIPKGYKLREKYPIPKNLPKFRAAARRLVTKLRSQA